MDNNEKTTKLTLVKNSLDNFFDPTLILENSYFRVRLVYQDIEIIKEGHKKERFVIDAIVINPVYRNYLPYISGTYDNPVLQMPAATVPMSMFPILKESINAVQGTIDEIQKFLNENY